MDISRVKYNLNKSVRLTLPRHYVDKDYILTGCIIRKNKHGKYFYQAELSEPVTGSIVIAELGDIEEKLSSPTVGGQKGR